MTDNSSAAPSQPAAGPGRRSWQQIVAPYHQPVTWRAVWQLVNTLVPYAAVWYLVYLALPVSIWLTVPLVLLAGGLLIRIFIIFHDCTHQSFFKSRRVNEWVGSLLGVLCFTPYYRWRWEHSVHHASAGNLDRRGTGDIWTLTVREYLEASPAKRFAYRLARNPIILFLIAPLVLFLIVERIPTRKEGRRERLSVYGTNLGLGLLVVGLCWVFGWKTYLLLQLGAVTVAACAGVWLFYVQHQFDDVYWEKGEEWDYEKAALEGSSYYQLPRVLQWFSGNIGFHHIHHLSPRIPNYHLERCHRAEPMFRNVKPITLLSSFKCLGYRLWDERTRRMVGYPASS